MAFNGSGLFVRVHDWSDDADASIDIEADRMDEEDDGFATGLSTCIAKDGQTTITANLPMAGFRHTGVGNASARTHYAVVGQVQDNTYTWVDGGGTGDAITATYTPNVTILTDGMELKVRAVGANTLTNPTFSPNGLPARTITKNGGSALAASDIAGDNHELTLRYFLASTRWELLNPAIPATVATAPFADTTALIKGSADATKLVRFEADGLTAGVTRVVTVPDADITLAGLASPAFTGNPTSATTPTYGDNDTTLANTAFVQAAVGALSGNIGGFLLSSIAGNSTTASLTVSAGIATDSTSVFQITKTTTTSWAASNGNAINGYQGGTTLPNSDTIHIFMCYGASGVGSFAHNGVTPTPPSGYNTYYRRVGSFKTTGAGAPLPYTSLEISGGATVNYLTTQVLDVNVSNLSTSRVSYTLSIPAGVKMQAIMRGGTTSGFFVVFTSLDETDVAPAAVATTVPGFDSVSASGGTNQMQPFLTTNTSSQIGARSTAGSTVLAITTRGWVDFRRV